MKNQLNNHKLLEKISGFHKKNSIKPKVYAPWFIDVDTYMRRKTPFSYYYPKVTFLIIAVFLIIFTHQMINMFHTADICSPALNKANWDMNNCEIKTGQTWHEYAWPNGY